MNRTPLRRLGLAAAAAALSAGMLVAGSPAVAETIEEASFVDPTATLTAPARITLGEQVYVGPFAQLMASRRSPIVLGEESNAQDNVRVEASASRGLRDRQAVTRLGLRAGDGVQTGERVILAHGSSVRGPALLGVGEASETDSGVFISFSAQVDGAIIERDSGLSALSRVGPGVRLRSGLIVLPGKNVTTQAEADDPALGKVRPITDADREFNAAVVEVNIGLAREYTRLQEDDPSAVRGINVDPGGNPFDIARDAPTVESALCTGPEVTEPAFRDRIIGDVCFEDSLAGLDAALGDRISLRADEGGPFSVGTIASMGDSVVFHALEGSDLSVGDRVVYGPRTIVHGGGRPVLDPTTGVAAPTVIGNDVTLGDGAVVFRSLVRNGVMVGNRSAVIGSDLALGQVIPPNTIYLNDEVFGPVEW